MKCRDLLRSLGAHLDGETGSALCEELDRHLVRCPTCRLVLDTARKTIELYRDGSPVDLPLSFRKKLHTSLRERWGRHSSNRPRRV